ncbi:unnamed protein product [Haemonchus placei]|uniref:ZP domain-containing protein n=1 Tax=Haemonchus placei TaxID=6290 RepID=A0A158QLV0_HAEPC|nr:unnamed protein product [Haemonchus placei]
MPLQYVDLRRLLNIFFLCLVYFELCDGEYVVPTRTAITDISAMCSSQGITSSIVFDGPFSGKIYSPDYATVRECIYYDGQNQENVLFSIPVHRCGTRLTRTSRNLVDQMESRVYVQMEHEAQTAQDQQFLFVCQLAGAKVGAESAYEPSQFRVSTHVRPVQVSAFSVDGHFGNWPIPGARPYSASVAPVATPPFAAAADLPAKIQGSDGYAISPARNPSVTNSKDLSNHLSSAIVPARIDTQSVQKPNIFLEPVKTAASPPGVLRSLSVTQVAQKSAEPQTGLYVTPEEPRMVTSRLVSTQEYHAPTELSLEVQQGNGPFAPAVNSPLKIGDNITLVVRSKSSQEYDMFVHSCFASNGQGNEKIDLIDENGCASHPQFASPLNRTKDPSGIMYYFFRITAFKFPGPNDVYFSCSIEMTPFRDAPVLVTPFLLDLFIMNSKSTESADMALLESLSFSSCLKCASGNGEHNR